MSESEIDPLRSLFKAILDKGEEKIDDLLTYTKDNKRFYGSLPAYANEMFGRSDEVKNIKELLNKNKHVLIYGEHGVGKTMLAEIVCKEFRKSVLWYSVGYENISSSKVCGRILLEIFEIEIPNKEQIEKMLIDNIKSNQIKAIFLDNIDSISVIRRFLSICNTLKIPLLVTSHSGNINGALGHNQKFEIAKLEKKYAIDLFKDQLPPEFIIKKEDENIIEEICEILDYHPFDIQITAGNMRYFSELSELKEKIENKKTALKYLKDSRDDRTYLGHNSSLELTYEGLNEPNKNNFLTIASYPSKSISFSLIEKIIPNLNINLKNLIDLNLIKLNKDNKRFEVHYFTNLFSIEKLENNNKAEIKSKVINSVKGYLIDNSDWDNYGKRKNIIDEIDNILGIMEWCAQSEDWENLIDFENIMRHYLYVLGQWDERIKWSQKVWDLRNNAMIMNKRGHNVTMAGVEGLGFVYALRGEDEEVNDILNSAERILTLNTEDKKWQRIWCYYHRIKGMLALNKHLLNDAKDEFEKAIIFAKKSDWETMEIPIGIQLGIPFIEQRNYEDAIKIFNNSINLAYKHSERKPDEIPPYRRIIRALIWLGKCYCKQKMFEESREKFIRAERLYKEKKLIEPLLIDDIYFEWGLLEIEANNRKRAKRLLARIDDYISYYWSEEKLKSLDKIENELNI